MAGLWPGVWNFSGPTHDSRFRKSAAGANGPAHNAGPGSRFDASAKRPALAAKNGQRIVSAADDPLNGRICDSSPPPRRELPILPCGQNSARFSAFGDNSAAFLACAGDNLTPLFSGGALWRFGCQALLDSHPHYVRFTILNSVDFPCCLIQQGFLFGNVLATCGNPQRAFQWFVQWMVNATQAPLEVACSLFPW